MLKVLLITLKNIQLLMRCDVLLKEHLNTHIVDVWDA